MWVLLAAALASLFWFLFRRWRRSLPIDQRLTLPYWRNSLLLTGAYLLFVLLGAGVTRIMVGFNRSGWADLVMVAFFAVWVLYGGLWLMRFLPTTRPRPVWLTRSKGWLDGAALLLLAGLATLARLL
tara:strand:+ start:567 stop:947 length:381 start_codon:yes stop_codon:yes gene_type:complete